jgi:hypothetical protein
VSATIAVTRASDGPPAFDVRVADREGETRHCVTLSPQDHARLGQGASAEKTIEAAFRFLLDREPKEMILPSFDIGVIRRYFPEFDAKLPDYLAA